jgi:RNA polymerase sigma-70 factor (ECF subfamily)
MSEARAEAQSTQGQHGETPTYDIDRLFDDQATKVRGLCRFLLGSRDAAEDAVSEVYLKARRAQALYDARQPFGVWIMSVARHYCFDVLRRRRVEARLFGPGEIGADEIADPASRSGAPLARVLDRESQQDLRRAIERLPRRYRLPLVLRYYEDLSYDQIAQELGITRQGVATLLFRAKQKLRAALGSAVPMGDA